MVFRMNSVNSVRVVHHAHVFTQDSVRPMSVLPTIMTMMRAVSVQRVLAQVCRVAHHSVPVSVHVRAVISSAKAVISHAKIVKADISHVSSVLHMALHVRVDTRVVKAVISSAEVNMVRSHAVVTSHVSLVRAAMDSVLHTVLHVRADIMPRAVVITSTISRAVLLTVPQLHIIRRSILLVTIPMLSIA
jgi:hypothetical protein